MREKYHTCVSYEGVKKVGRGAVARVLSEEVEKEVLVKNVSVELFAEPDKREVSYACVVRGCKKGRIGGSYSSTQ